MPQHDLELDFADFQSDSVPKEKLCDLSHTDFCSKYVSPSRSSEVRLHTLLMLSMFGSV